MKISVIIPTYNEEKYLPLLLGDLFRQTYKDFEVIVADAGSSDQTRSIALRHNAAVVRGGSPAAGRNSGEEAARGSLLVFLDADVRIGREFLTSVHDEMQYRNLGLASCRFQPITRYSIDRILHNIANAMMQAVQHTNPHAPGFCIIVSRDVFRKAGRFDETLRLGEDHEFVRRAAQWSCFGILKGTCVRVSVRRLEKEGRLTLSKKYLLSELNRIFLGEIREDIFEYEFGNFGTHSDNNLEMQLLQLDNALRSINGMTDKAQRIVKRLRILQWQRKTRMEESVTPDYHYKYGRRRLFPIRGNEKRIRVHLKNNWQSGVRK